MATLTVLLCNYNHAHFVATAIEAIATQSRLPDEFIIVDDGSTDNSISVIEPYAQKYPFIKFFKNPVNKGLMWTFAHALSMATGDFIYCASADDYTLPGFYEKAMAMADKHPQSGVIVGQVKIKQRKLLYVA